MTEQSINRFNSIKKVLIWVLVLNWLVALAKILYGLSSHCSSILADGLHSLSDGASNIVGLVGITIASQPKDQDHPYGHKKYETFFSLGIAALLILVCFNLFKEGISRLNHPIPPQIDYKSFIIMFVTLAVNIMVMNYEFKKGKSLKSDILVSDSLHTKADVLTSFSVIIALVFIKLGFAVMDPVITLVIAVFIGKTIIDIIKESSKVLCDSAVILDTKEISGIVLSVKGVKSCHKIRTRGREDDVYVDLHVLVSPHMHIDQAHKISLEIEESIKKNINGVSDVVVHIEPREGHPEDEA